MANRFHHARRRSSASRRTTGRCFTFYSFTFCTWAIGVIALLAAALPAVSLAGGIPCAGNPDLMCYGDFMGDSVWYRMVREGSNTDDPLPLFGMPTVSGNSLDFDPVGFSASVDGPTDGTDMTDGNLAFMIEAKAGNSIENIKFDESGDVTLSGLSPPEAFAKVRTPIFLDIVEVDGVGINPIKLDDELVMSFSPSDGDFYLSIDGGGGPNYFSIWNGSLLVDVEQVLIDEGIGFDLGATKVTVNLDNVLTAVAQSGVAAVIAKKDNGLIVTTNIPEPATCLVALVGLATAMLVVRSARHGQGAGC